MTVDIESEVRHLFATPLVQLRLAGCEGLLQELRALILARSEADPGVGHSNRGGWQSRDDLLNWGGAATEQIFRVIRAAIDSITMVYTADGLARQPVPWKVNAWANVNRSGHGNDLHCHPGGFWSGCFYVDDGGIGGREGMGGAIEFYDPRGPLPIAYNPLLKMAVKGCMTAGLGERVLPETGKLLIFPSWLTHSVQAYDGAGIRISVAFNFSV
jgi:uncharacterized protein (TIGR02466 family)